MTALRFLVLGTPQGKGRAKPYRTGDSIRMYTPDKTASYESHIGYCAKVAMRKAAFAQQTGPVGVELTIQLGVPRSWPTKRRQAALDGGLYPTVKPDADNVAKAICDALNGIAWVDDAQVVELVARKCYAVAPGVWVRIWPVLAPGDLPESGPVKL